MPYMIKLVQTEYSDSIFNSQSAGLNKNSACRPVVLIKFTLYSLSIYLAVALRDVLFRIMQNCFYMSAKTNINVSQGKRHIIVQENANLLFRFISTFCMSEYTVFDK